MANTTTAARPEQLDLLSFVAEPAPVPRPTVTLPVSLAGRTQGVEFRLGFGGGQAAVSNPVFTARIGRGTKTHRVTARAWMFETAEAARRKGYGRDSMVEVDGQVWGLQLHGMALNRQARITGWVEDGAATSRHIMER